MIIFGGNLSKKTLLKHFWGFSTTKNSNIKAQHIYFMYVFSNWANKTGKIWKKYKPFQSLTVKIENDKTTIATQ